MFLSRLLVGGALCVGCVTPVTFGAFSGEGVKAGEFIFSKNSLGGA